MQPSFHIKNIARKMAGLVKIKKPLVSRWYFWAPIGVIAVGAGAFIAVKTLNEDDGSGGADNLSEIIIDGVISEAK